MEKVKDVKYIKINTELFEEILIDIKDIDWLDIKGVSDEYIVYKCTKELSKTRRCEKLVIAINKSADKPFGGVDEGLTIFERMIRNKDVDNITFLDKDMNVIDTFVVPWNGYDDSLHEKEYIQDARINEEGNLEIQIYEKEKAQLRA